MYTSVDELPRDMLLQLLYDNAKNWMSIDGLWFQSVEHKRGLEEALEHDVNAWKIYSRLEARRIKNLLDLGSHSGLEGLAQALAFRMQSLLCTVEIKREGDSLLQQVRHCQVQAARARKGLPLHPCQPVGMTEHTEFAKEIDGRIVTECVSCYPHLTDETSSCVWRYHLR